MRERAGVAVKHESACIHYNVVSYSSSKLTKQVDRMLKKYLLSSWEDEEWCPQTLWDKATYEFYNCQNLSIFETPK